MLPGLSSILAGQGATRSLTFTDHQISTTDTDTYTIAMTFGAAAGDRVLVAVIAGDSFGGATIDAVTIGGVAAPIRVQASSGLITAGIASAIVPSGTSGNVVVGFSDGLEEVSVGLWAVTGADNATPHDTDSRTTAGALTIDAIDGGAFIGGIANRSARTTTWTNATEQYDGGASTFRYSGASETVSGTSITVTPTLSGAATNLVFVAATF